MSWKKTLRKINKVGSVAKDIDALTSGNPKKIVRRTKNKTKAKLLSKSGFWKW